MRKPDRGARVGVSPSRYTVLALETLLALGASEAARAGNGIQLIGFGLDQTAVAGAVTANPNSPMTIATNPAGLILLTPRADFSAEAIFSDIRLDARRSVFTLASPANPGEKRKSSDTVSALPQVGVVLPTRGAKLAVGVGLFGSGLGVDFGTMRLNTVGNPSRTPSTLKSSARIGLFRLSPALAYRVSPRLSVGGSLNLSLLQLRLRQEVAGTFHPNEGGEGAYDSRVKLEPSNDAFGIGATVGLLYEVIPGRLRAGASYTTQANLEGSRFRLNDGDVRNPNLIKGPIGEGSRGSYTLDFDFPQQAAVGVSFQPLGSLQVSADVKWIDYSHTQKVLRLRGPDGTYHFETDWRDVRVYALGLSYKPAQRLRLMVGYNHSNAPVPEDALVDNLLTAVISEDHFTAGTKYSVGKKTDLGIYVLYSPRATQAGKGDLTDRRRILAVSDDSGFEAEGRFVHVGFGFGYAF